MLKRPHFIALGLVGLLALIVLSLPHHTAGQLKLAIGSLFLPLFGLSKSSQQLSRETGDALTPRAQLLRDNEALRRTNQSLQLVSAQNEILVRQNNHLRELLQWQQQTSWSNRLRLASVEARDPANWWQIIHIDLGSRDGMRADLPVLTADGYLVGRIREVSLTHSEVLLVGDPAGPVAAHIETKDKAGENGVILGGAGPLDPTLVVLSYLSPASTAKPGQWVSTSGKAILPGGIRIGQVAEAPRPTELGYSEVRVKLGANPAALEEVWVLLP